MRLAWADIARGIGIVLVVYGHVLRGIHDADIGLNENFFFYSDTFVYGFHMPLFFLLSGLFVSSWESKPFAAAAGKKIHQLLLPYLIWSLLQGSVMIVLSGATNSSTLTWSGLPANIGWSPIGQFWFLYALFFMFILYYVLNKFLPKPVMLLVGLAVFAAMPLLELNWIVEKFGSHFVYFLAGACLARYKAIVPRLFKPAALYASSAAFILVNALYLWAANRFYDAPGFQYLGLAAAAAGVAFVIALSYRLQAVKGTTWLKSLGLSSMSIYLVHILAASGTRIVLDKGLHIGDPAAHIVLGTIMGIAVPLVVQAVARGLRLDNVLFASRQPTVKGQASA